MYAVGEQQKFPEDIKHTFTSRSLHLWFLLECFFPQIPLRFAHSLHSGLCSKALSRGDFTDTLAPLFPISSPCTHLPTLTCTDSCTPSVCPPSQQVHILGGAGTWSASAHYSVPNICRNAWIMISMGQKVLKLMFKQWVLTSQSDVMGIQMSSGKGYNCHMKLQR